MGVRLIAVLLLALLATGCVSTQDGVGIIAESWIADPPRTTAETRVDPDQHTGTTVVSGPMVAFTNGTEMHHFRLRAWYDPREPRSEDIFAVVVRGKFDRRVYLGDAYAAGQKIKTEKIDAERVCDGGCITYETVAVMLSEEELRGRAKEGFLFRVTARRAMMVVRVPAGHFEGFIAAYDAARGQQKEEANEFSQLM